MKWDRIEENWGEFKDRAKQQWGELSVAQLDVIAGKRDCLASGIQETYGISKHAAEWQLSGWQHRQHKLNRPRR